MVQDGGDLTSLLSWVLILQWASFLLPEVLRRTGRGASHGRLVHPTQH